MNMITEIGFPKTSFTSTILRNGSTLANINLHTYAYNNGHQRTNQTRVDGSYVDYLYDDIGQLYSAKTYASGGTETTTQRRVYTYDAAWNLTKTTNSTTVDARTVNTLNQITLAGGYSHSHDANGNRTIGSQYSIYSYDDENQLTQFYNDPVPFGSGAKKTEFVYDGKGRLRVRKEYSWGSAPYNTWLSDGETRYIYANGASLQSGHWETAAYDKHGVRHPSAGR